MDNLPVSSASKEKGLFSQTIPNSLARSETFRLILHRPYAGNHSSWELTCPGAISYLEDIWKLSFPTSGPYILFSPCL